MGFEEDVVIRSKVRLQTRSPFFSYLIQTLDIKTLDLKDMPSGVKSACVDCKGHVSINKEFVATIGEERCIGVLCHEVLHIAFDHFGREGGRDKKVANMAQDIAINDVIVSNGFDLPTGLVPDKSHCITVGSVRVEQVDTKTWEEIYDELMKGDVGDPQGWDVLIGSDESSDDDSSGAEDDSVGRSIAAGKLLSDAVAYAKLQGSEPAGIKRRLADLLASNVDWRDILQAYVTRSMMYDYSFSRPSRRSHATGVYLPSVVKEGLDVVVALDTSGSISTKDLRRFASEVLGITSSFQGVTVHVIEADAAVHRDTMISGDYEGQVCKIEAIGGGGTSHVPVFEYVAKKHPSTRVLICFTDGFTDFPQDIYDFDTVWALSKDSIRVCEVPFGRALKVNE